MNSRRRYVLLYGAVVVAVVAGRGCTVAWVIGGRYPISAFLFDVVAAGLLLGVLRGIDYGLQWCIRTFCPSRPTWRVSAQTARLAFVALVILPFLITALSVHPQRIACRATPEMFGLPFEEVDLDSGGIGLRAWYVPGANDSGPVILVAHGLGANKQNFLPPVAQLHSLGYPVLIHDFRGHGDSGGLTITYGLHEAQDVRAAHDWLAQRHPGRPVCALAYSMGAAAVARAANEYGIFDRIVLDSTFSSVRNVAQARFLRFFGPLDSLVWWEIRLWGWIWTGADVADSAPARYADVLRQKPVLLIHGTDDSMIPCAEARRLHEALGDNAELWLIKGAGHAESILAPEYEDRLRSFFEPHCKSSL